MLNQNNSITSTRFSSPNFAHISALQRDGSRDGFRPDPLWQLSFRKLFTLPRYHTFPQHLLQHHFFINFDDSDGTGWRDRSSALPSSRPGFYPRNFIWIRYEFIPLMKKPTGIVRINNTIQADTAITQTNKKRALGYEYDYHSPPKGHTEPTEMASGFSITCDEFCAAGILGYLTERRGGCISGGSNSSEMACVLQHVIHRLRFPVFITAEKWEKSAIRKRHTSTASGSGKRKGALLKSLVFLARKRFSTLEDILKPLNLFTSMVIIVTSGAVAVVLAVIKMVTSGPDQTWYDYFIQQILDLVQDARKKKTEENGNKAEEEKVESRLDVGMNGKMSRSVLHGTIQIVSFILVAIYEGKLYSTITLPKSRFISTFDDLLTNDKYTIKLSREAADVSLILGAKNLSVMNRFSQSFNIEDCISFAERSVSHGCVAYDFELRNLPKTQRAKMLQEEKFFAKTKTSIIGRQKIPMTFHPAAHISRWILEAGFFQFWMLAENVFTDSLITSKTSPHKLFSIKDYLGLLVVYAFLLFLATLVFCSEFMAAWIRPYFQERSLLEVLNFLRATVTSLARRLQQVTLMIRSFLARGKRWARIRRIVNIV